MSDRLTTSARPLPRPDADLGYLFRLAHQRFRALLDSELEDLGLSAQDYGILSLFGTRPELSTSELARISQVTRQTMHTSILSLEAAGLVERSARNQRVVLVRPTTRGRQCLETATRRVRVVEHAALADFSPEDERTIRVWLAALAGADHEPREGRGRTEGEVMNYQARATGNLERRIRDAERNLFAAVGADVEEFFLDLAQTGLRVRVLSHGRGPAIVLLHGVSESAAIWAPLFTELPWFPAARRGPSRSRLVRPGCLRRGQVREHARQLIDDILDALGLDEVPVIGHSLGGMFALWHVAAGSRPDLQAWSRSESPRSRSRAYACGCRCRC